MTTQEKWNMTMRYMQMVRGMHASGGAQERRGRIRGAKRTATAERWREVIEQVCRNLRSREGKSAARARHDWLVARAIEMTVFHAMTPAQMRGQLAVVRPVHEQYAASYQEAGVRAVMAAAEEAGLLGGE